MFGLLVYHFVWILDLYDTGLYAEDGESENYNDKIEKYRLDHLAPPPSIELEPPALQTGVQANYTRAAKMEDPEGLKPSTF